ncbi:DUF1850 domain-containing protein [Treponema sp.]|uniref:DUF1850 domain-containing protein n=1 Tax=Treponema sp. TaxID=166 RepID=UPI00388E8284
MKKLFLLTALVILTVVNLPLVQVLSISNRKNFSEKIYSFSAVKQGFTISYTHSVNKGRVHDFYRVLSDGNLELFMTEFVSYGAGIPESYETEDSVFRVTENGYVIENLHRHLPRLVMAVGVVAEHSVAVSNKESPLETDFDKEFFLKTFFKPQTSLLFEVRRVSVLSYVFTKKI